MQSSVAELNNTGNSLIQPSCIPILVMKLWLNHWELTASQCHLFLCIKLKKKNWKYKFSIVFTCLCSRLCFIHPVKLCAEYQIVPSLVVEHLMLKLSLHCTGCKDYLWLGLWLEVSLMGYLKLWQSSIFFKTQGYTVQSNSRDPESSKSIGNEHFN